MVLSFIVGCEIGFWVFLAAGLSTRYLLRMRRLSVVLLLCVPLVDVVLLVATVAHLRGGATADVTHGLAATYIGFSVAFGHSTINWADRRFAHRFAGGPPPRRPPRYGMARARQEWREFGKALVAWAVSCGLLLAAIWMVGDEARTQELYEWLLRLTIILGVWALWPITYTLWPAKPKGQDDPSCGPGRNGS